MVKYFLFFSLFLLLYCKANNKSHDKLIGEKNYTLASEIFNKLKSRDQKLHQENQLEKDCCRIKNTNSSKSIYHPYICEFK